MNRSRALATAGACAVLHLASSCSSGESSATRGGSVPDASAPPPLNVHAQARVEGSSLAWFQTQKLTASDATTGDGFGSSVSVSGTTAMIAAGTGLYVFGRSGATWTQQQKVSPAGDPLVVSGTMAIGGSAGDTGYQGAAYTYAQSGTTWTQQQKLAEGGSASGYFGAAVALSGTRAIVGAYSTTVGSKSEQGAAYVFVQSGTTWTLEQELLASDGAAADHLGASVALSGTTALVGNASQNSPGAVYAFTRSGTTWTQQQKITAGDSIVQDSFGYPISLSGTIALIGQASLPTANPGGVYVFVQSGASATWSLQQKLTASDATANVSDSFGSSVSLSGTTAVVGADDETIAGMTYQGAAYVFTQSGTTWTQQQKLTAGGMNQQFGISVAVSGTTIFVGARGTSSIQGAVYIESVLSTNASSCGAATDCGSGFCVAGVCCDSACGACGDCSTGTCSNLAAGSAGNPTCSPLVCSGTSAACPTTCAEDPDCSASDYCSGSQCVPRQANATACSAPDQCLSGTCFGGQCLGTTPAGSACGNASDCSSSFCIDGVCCDRACTGQCEGCDVAGSMGKCTPVAGAPHGSRPACSGAQSQCGGACDGTVGAGCSYPPATTPCGSSCANAQEADSTCNGQGDCVAVAPHSCNNLVCADDTKCKTSCASDADCIAGFECTAGQCHPAGSICVDRHTSRNASQVDSGVTDCAPYACNQDAGKCLQKCASVDDCDAPSLCNHDGQCVAPPSPGSGDDPTSASSSSGGCAAAQGGAGGGDSVLVLLGVALAARRRRARVPSHSAELPGPGACS
jgi:hypothetical protein